MQRTEFFKIFTLALGVFFLSYAQSGANHKDFKKEFGTAAQEKSCDLCHKEVNAGVDTPWHESPLGQAGVNCVMRRLGYYETKLVNNLLKIHYPLNREDITALDKIGMRFDTKNRIDVLEKILQDREAIHSLPNIDYFTKTEVVYDALRLLDEHDLPHADKLIDALNQQKGWEKSEKALLAFMAAKRNFRYPSNVSYLVNILMQIGNDQERIYKGEVFHAIIDQMNILSFLSDLFIFKGDRDILKLLITYSLRTYGFPGEYLSHMFVEMFLFRPKIFISSLEVKDDHVVDEVMKAMVFGVSNNQLKKNVKDALQKDVFIRDAHDHERVESIIKNLNSAVDELRFNESN